MEVKNVSETPFLFGFTAPSSGAELPEGEFASVLAGVNEPGTTLPTKAEVVGTEPIAPLQILDSPELEQGDIGYDLVLNRHAVVASFVKSDVDDDLSPLVEGSDVAVDQSSTGVDPAKLVDPANRVDPENLADGSLPEPASDEILERVHVQIPVASQFNAPLSPDYPDEVDVPDLRSLIAAESVRTQREPANPSPIIVRLPSNEATLDSKFRVSEVLTDDQQSRFPRSMGAEVVEIDQSAGLEIASGLQRVGQTFESLHQLIVSSLKVPIEAVSSSSPAQPLLSGVSEDQYRSGNDVEVATSPVGNVFPDKATYLQVSEALGIVGISFSEETALESPPLDKVAVSPEKGSSSTAAIGLELGANEDSKTLPDLIAPKIEIERSAHAKPTEGPKTTDLNPTQVERQPDSVRHAVAYTWAALQREANSASGQKKVSPVPLGTSVPPAQASSPMPTVSGDIRLPEGGGAQVLLHESKSLVQPQAKPSAEPLTITSEALGEWEPTERGLAEIAPQSESMDPTLLPRVKVSTENSGARIESPEGSKKTSDGRLTIEGNHSLMEIRSETVRKVAEHLDRLLVTRSKSESVIRMQPEELGSITMVVRNIKNDIEAVVTASDERVRELLHESRQDLIHNLNQKGHSEVRVTVAAETNSTERQPFNRDSSNPHDQSQRSSTSSDFGSNSNGQSFSREQEREGSHSNRIFRFEDERINRTETTPSKKTETFRRFQKVIDVAI